MRRAPRFRPMRPQSGVAALGIRQSLPAHKIEAALIHAPLGVVDRGQDRRRRPVLIKLLPALAGDRAASSWIASELFRIAALRHPNIIPVVECGDVDGVPFVVAADEPDLSLAERLASGRLDRKTALAVLRDVARAIDYAHAMGVFHGALEPAVVKLARDGTPLVADFGLARLARASRGPRRSAVGFGAAAYLAPEDILGHPAGPAADVYAFAAIGYDLLTGAVPFDDPGT